VSFTDLLKQLRNFNFGCNLLVFVLTMICYSPIAAWNYCDKITVKCARN